MKKVFIVSGIFLLLLVGCQKQNTATQYTCPMHQEIIRDEPGTCPICGMTLVPVEKGEIKHQHKHPEGAIQVTPERRQLIGLKTAVVEKRSLSRQIRLPGRVAFDRDLYITEQEYVSGLRFNVGSDILGIIEKKLELLGLSSEELMMLKGTKKADNALFLPASGGNIWIYANVFEADLSWVEKGMRASIERSQDASVKMEGVVQAVTPILDPVTRTATARIRIENPGVDLKPETYVNVTLKKDLGELLAISADALIDTGEKKIAFVDFGEGYLTPTEVKVGFKAGDYYPVLEGLQEGDSVVTSAQFLIDSEAWIQAARKRFGAPVGGHQH